MSEISKDRLMRKTPSQKTKKGNTKTKNTDYGAHAIELPLQKEEFDLECARLLSTLHVYFFNNYENSVKVLFY